MEKKDFKFTEEEIAQALRIDVKKLDQIILKLINESILSPNQHFRYQNKKLKIKLLSEKGVIALATHLGDVNQVEALKKIIKYKKNDQIDCQISKTIYEYSSSLFYQKRQHWLIENAVYKIFKTTKSRLNRSFKNIQRSNNPMIFGRDFDEIKGIRCFSLSGIEKLSLDLSSTLSDSNRREYCERVSFLVTPIIKELARSYSPSEKEIKQAMNYAKKRDQEKCQVTEEKRTKYNKIELVKHHLFDKNKYKFLAADPDNIITISKTISDQFHQWNGGYQISCTIDDFIDYIESFHPTRKNLLLKLYNQKEVLQKKFYLHPLRYPEIAATQTTYQQLNLFD